MTPCGPWITCGQRRAARRRDTQHPTSIGLSRNSTLWSWQPQVRYHLLDMGAFPGNNLARRPGLAAILFRLERPLDREDLDRLVGEAIDWFRRHPAHERLRHMFAELVREAFKGHGVQVPRSNDLHSRLLCGPESDEPDPQPSNAGSSAPSPPPTCTRYSIRRAERAARPRPGPPGPCCWWPPA